MKRSHPEEFLGAICPLDSSFGAIIETVYKRLSSYPDTIIDLQARTMRDDIVFAGIPEKGEEFLEWTVKDCRQKQLKLNLPAWVRAEWKAGDPGQ